MEKECLAIKLAVTAFRVYLLGRKFTIQRDHRSLEDSNPRLCRWSLGPYQYTQYTVVHRPGKANGNADSLSRIASNRSVAGEGRWRVEDRLPIQSVNSSMPIELSGVTGHIQFGHLKETRT